MKAVGRIFALVLCRFCAMGLHLAWVFWRLCNCKKERSLCCARRRLGKWDVYKYLTNSLHHNAPSSRQATQYMPEYLLHG